MLEFRLNLKGKVVHGPDATEGCNIDDADEVRTVGFTGAAMAWHDDDFSVCGHCIGWAEDADDGDKRG